MEGFTLSLALLDYVPVAAFGAAGIIAGAAMGSPLFTIGAAISFLAGLMKATWKLILGVWKKDIGFMNRAFLPMQLAGWLIMLPAGIIGIFKAGGAKTASVLFGSPQIIFFILWIAAMCGMVWYKKTRFQKYDARSNWTAEIINSLGQIFFLLAVIFAA